jgi:polyferredoxin
MTHRGRWLMLLLIITLVLLVQNFGLGSEDKLLWHPQKKLTLLEYLQYSHLWVTILFGLGGAALLMFIKMKRWLRGTLMVLVFFIFGILPALSGLRCALREPSPLCALIRPTLILKSGNPNLPFKFIVTIVAIGALSLVGNKLFCSWVCPIGALQEAVNFIPLKVKKMKLPFFWMNIIRALLIILFLPVLYLTGQILYDLVNPFIPLRWGISDPLAIYSLAFLGVTLVASVYLYRPYCYLICPIGIIIWILEQVTPLKVRFYRERCNDCRICIEQTPCPTVESIIQEKRIRPDCHSCGRCIEVCPTDALQFRCK